MQVGVAATVTTVAAGETLETGAVSTGQVVTSRQISELPLTEGTAYQLATLAPGIAYTGNRSSQGPPQTAIWRRFAQTVLPAQTRSLWMAHPTMRLMVRSASRLRQTLC